MTTVAVTMVRDEDDILGFTLVQMVENVDHVIVADNLSTDRTRDVIERVGRFYPGRVTLVDDYDPAHTQSRKVTALALRARLEHGADWIVPFDADEYWYSPFGRIADILDDVTGEQWLTVHADLYDHVTTDLDDADLESPIERIRWRKVKAAPLPKVACRWREDMVIEEGNHGARYTGGATQHPARLVIRHYPCRSAEQFIRKVRNGSRALRAAGDDVPAHAGTHWRGWGDILDAHGEEAVADIYRTWYHRATPHLPEYAEGELLPQLIDDPAPRP